MYLDVEHLTPRPSTQALAPLSMSSFATYLIGFIILIVGVAIGAYYLNVPQIWIIVGIIAGWATRKIMKGSGYGVLWDLVLGIVGAIVGGWIVGALGLSAQGGLIWSILVAIVGAVIVVWVFRLVTGRRRAV